MSTKPGRKGETDDTVQVALHTPLCGLLGCRYPLILAGMGGVARSELVAAVTEAGGFGFLGMVREPPELIRSEVERVRSRTARAFGVNLVPAATPAPLLERQIEMCIELAVPVVGLFWTVRPEIIGRLREAGILVVHQVGSAAEGQQAVWAGADVLIAQGVEAGGHVRARQPLTRVLAEVLAIARVPVAAAGGIADGEDVARVLAHGAQGAVLGTALLATEESFAHDYHKRRLVEARDTDTVLTESFWINWPPHAPVRVLRNSVTRGEHGDAFAAGRTVIGEEEGRPIYLFSTDSPLKSMTGNFEAMALYAGKGAGRIHAVEPAARCIERIVAAAARSGQRESPANAGSAARGTVAGELGESAASLRTRAILSRLDELLEAERAGARIALRSAVEARNEEWRKALETLHCDEVRWCAMLIRNIRKLRGTPSARTDMFYDRTMTITDLPERMRLVNRGQKWVVGKLGELLAIVEDTELRNDLSAMLDAHQDSVDMIYAVLHPPP